MYSTRLHILRRTVTTWADLGSPPPRNNYFSISCCFFPEKFAKYKAGRPLQEIPFLKDISSIKLSMSLKPVMNYCLTCSTDVLLLFQHFKEKSEAQAAMKHLNQTEFRKKTIRVKVSTKTIRVKVSTNECIPVGCVPPAAVAVYPPRMPPAMHGPSLHPLPIPPVNRITDRCKNTLPPDGNKYDHLEIHRHRENCVKYHVDIYSTTMLLK